MLTSNSVTTPSVFQTATPPQWGALGQFTILYNIINVTNWLTYTAMTIMTATEYIYVIANHKLYVIVSIRSMRDNVAIQKNPLAIT
jgi:hypothetical protein